MQISLPSKLRKAIYIIATIASPTLVYLNSEGVVTDFSLGLYTVMMGAVTALAAVNTDTSDM